MKNLFLISLQGLAFILLIGCSGSSDSSIGQALNVKQKQAQSSSNHYTQSKTLAKWSPVMLQTLAFVDGKPLTAKTLYPQLLEAAGGQILADYLLTQKLQQALKQAKLKIEQPQLVQEQRYLLAALNNDANQARRLLNKLKHRHGLGTLRFKQMIWRHAALRLLIQDQVVVPKAAVQQAYGKQYGARYIVRLIVIKKIQEAVTLLRQARNKKDFAQLAMTHSMDQSKIQGGLLSPISLFDATYPAAIRQAIAKLSPNQVSDPITLDDGFAIIRLEKKIASKDVAFKTVQAELALKVRLQIERLRMSQLARRLLEKVDVVILDSSLLKDWKNQKEKLNKMMP